MLMSILSEISNESIALGVGVISIIVCVYCFIYDKIGNDVYEDDYEIEDKEESIDLIIEDEEIKGDK